jgi:hypothetical protein
VSDLPIQATDAARLSNAIGQPATEARLRTKTTGRAPTIISVARLC